MNKREKEFSNQFIEISEEERERRKQKKIRRRIKINKRYNESTR